MFAAFTYASRNRAARAPTPNSEGPVQHFQCQRLVSRVERPVDDHQIVGHPTGVAAPPVRAATSTDSIGSRNPSIPDDSIGDRGCTCLSEVVVPRGGVAL